MAEWKTPHAQTVPPTTGMGVRLPPRLLMQHVGALAEPVDAADLNPAGPAVRVRLSRAPPVGRSFQLERRRSPKALFLVRVQVGPPARVRRSMEEPRPSKPLHAGSIPVGRAIDALIAQLERASPRGGEGWRFESVWARTFETDTEQRRLSVRRARLLNGMWQHHARVRAPPAPPSAAGSRLAAFGHMVSVVEWVNTPDCGSGDRRFEPGQTPHRQQALLVYGLGWRSFTPPERVRVPHRAQP